MFYEISQVIGRDKAGFSVSRHDCERGSFQHRQGDLGTEVAFFPQNDPNAKAKAEDLLRSLVDGC